ncbi:hypothetical protein KAT59_02845, partial [Candidatus Bipolaricaulota bacterium]|nr:hypothetical protein [Candidatus Bipolaricaulota bacterium]
LEQLWWRLDKALDPESVKMSARVGAMEAARCGVTTLIDHHASPHAVRGSLRAVQQAVNSDVGLRGAFCYELSDRDGTVIRDEGIEENLSFLAEQDPEDHSSAAVDDTLTNGPVLMYPESLEVTMTSTQESWATVVADGDTVFTDPFQPDSLNSFKALTELDFSLGNWEFITGSIYGHPLKPMRSFHIAGNEGVRLRITSENWESFIDSSKARNEQD